MKFSLFTLFMTAAAATLGGAAATPLAPRDVYVPPVLYPHAGTVWFVGQRHNVTWDNSNPPKQITNKIGRIMLRKGDLTTPVILADNFSILLGHIEVTVPWVEDGSDYQIVLFGDSGNFSPLFTISGP
ncbi:hypothetical protein R3P38DRAFT_2791830 [Favolaschia claudopus]|uniref:Yeast cell wall synthesis Kre9/Knh1-like N-terminal domain-containing protein n=1 Tax=Favolaschia claudopus TaxID=2862362 RepID=A0AAW0AIU4_9AGAR